ncbi:unnamed protein product [Rotaria sordida]|uniref:F-box domain-containing protein n=1 Tax=Rotaria sordida TaxID=392033 RepID=A0A815HJS2_9BILA|nr:unnamed protein product [Rotaria sordida]CAF1353149.1 unnamed protein product [Rotaria sordida]
MNSIQTSSLHWLEMFPDEIFLEIFKYVKPIDLHSFIGHNQRINNIIRDVKLNIIIEFLHKEDDLTYLMSFLPHQFIHLELNIAWKVLDLHSYTRLRSLKINHYGLSKSELDHILTAKLPCLEQFSICNLPFLVENKFLHGVLDDKHFPSLKMCQFSGSYCYILIPNKQYQSLNLTIRTLVLNFLNQSGLISLLNILPNLRRLETSFPVSIRESENFNLNHISLEQLRIGLVDPSNDLEKILPYIPNLKQLRVTGKINEQSILEHFQKLTKMFCMYTSNLEKFDCELYHYGCNKQIDIFIIQQLHPLFKMIQCHSGNNFEQCYTTDLMEFPISKLITCEFRPISSDMRSKTKHLGYYPEINKYDSIQHLDNDGDWV